MYVEECKVRGYRRMKRGGKKRNKIKWVDRKIKDRSDLRDRRILQHFSTSQNCEDAGGERGRVSIYEWT